jgi:hypothetical protein
MAVFIGSLAAPVAAESAGDETLSVVTLCFNWSCMARQEVTVGEADWRELGELLASADNPEHERVLIAVAIGRLYGRLAALTPIAGDRAGNRADAGVHGRMDCVDHSTTTTQLLHRLQGRGYLRFNRVIEAQRRTRFWVSQHLSAAVEEKLAHTLASADAETGQVRPRRFVIDSWFVNPGEAAVVLPLDNWMDGEGPDVD